jgi:hypothetical protein
MIVNFSKDGEKGAQGQKGEVGAQGPSGAILLSGSTTDGIITYDGSGGGVVESNITFDGTDLTTSGDIHAKGIYFDGAAGDTYISANADVPEDLEIHADQDILLLADGTTVIGATGSNSPLSTHTKLSVEGVSYFGSHTIRKYPDSSDTFFGNIVTFGSGPSGSNASLELGKIYYYAATGYWEEAQAHSESTSKGLLAVCVKSGSVWMMTLGNARHGSWAGLGEGNPLYLSSTTSGELTNTAPTTSGTIVRFVGYSIGSTTRTIYFCPSPDYIEN